MITIMAASRRVKEEIANAGVPPPNKQAPPQEQAPLRDKALVNSPSMMDRETRMTFINLDQYISTQYQALDTQV